MKISLFLSLVSAVIAFMLSFAFAEQVSAKPADPAAAAAEQVQARPTNRTPARTKQKPSLQEAAKEAARKELESDPEARGQLVEIDEEGDMIVLPHGSKTIRPEEAEEVAQPGMEWSEHIGMY